jgi:hypothetical protein
MTTFQHLDRATECLEEAVIHYLDAARQAEFSGWKQKHIERIDLIKRATARVRKDMQADAVETAQEELMFG